MIDFFQRPSHTHNNCQAARPNEHKQMERVIDDKFITHPESRRPLEWR